jgi:hypothetical protein
MHKLIINFNIKLCIYYMYVKKWVDTLFKAAHNIHHEIVYKLTYFEKQLHHMVLIFPSFLFYLVIPWPKC